MTTGTNVLKPSRQQRGMHKPHTKASPSGGYGLTPHAPPLGESLSCMHQELAVNLDKGRYQY